MRRLALTAAAELVKSQLKQETQRGPQSVLLHRLHCVALVCAGFGSGEIAAAFGDDRRSVQRWVRRFEAAGIDGLRDRSATGRPARLAEPELQQLRLAVAADARSSGHASEAWDAEALRLEIRRRFGIDHSRRHCARLLGALRRPQPGGADAASGGPAPGTDRPQIG